MVEMKMIKVVEKNHRKNKLKVLKEKRGITLIALIVTIIILLILADPHIFLNIPQ